MGAALQPWRRVRLEWMGSLRFESRRLFSCVVTLLSPAAGRGCNTQPPRVGATKRRPSRPLWAYGCARGDRVAVANLGRIFVVDGTIVA